MMGGMFCAIALLAAATPLGRPVALMGFGTDVEAIKTDVTDRCRYESATFVDGWVEPSEYGRYSVLYFGEKLRGAAKGRNWRGGEARAAAERFIAGGGTVIVAGRAAMSELFGKDDPARPDPLREKVLYVPRSLGRVKVSYARSGKPLSFADDTGNDILTDEGRDVKSLEDALVAAFAKAAGVARLPETERWEAVPLGPPGNLRLPERFLRRPRLGKPLLRKKGLTLFDGKVAASIVLGDYGEAARSLAEELAWHLGKMSGGTFPVVAGEPGSGPALVYRRLSCPKDFARGNHAYFKIWREGDKVFLGGEGAGISRATTYVLEALGCRYIWPGETGKIIPKREAITLPEIDVADATPFAIRRMRLYGWPEFPDRAGNRDFWRWHGMNDTKTMTTDRPGDADGYQWGHSFGDFYPKYAKTHPEWFALQPDGTRTLHLGARTERPVFCLSNTGLVAAAAAQKIAEIKAHPEKKAVSLCLPDGATATWCMCRACRERDPVNAPAGSLNVFFPKRATVDYVSLTDRVFSFMNSVAEKTVAEYPGVLLSTYAYSCYTKPPVRVRPHPNLLILSVAGNYTDASNAGVVEHNLAAWSSFGNKVLWRPNVHCGFRVAAPDNLARQMFDDISVLAENGVFGFDYDTMYCEWATKAFVYYTTAKAHFNPDRLDFDSFADDFCHAGFGAAAGRVRAYFDEVARASSAAAEENAADPEPPSGWAQRRRRQNSLLRHLDFNALDALLASAREAAGDDAAVLRRLARLQFGNDIGRFAARQRIGVPSKPSAEETEAFRKHAAAYLASDPAAFKASMLGIR